MSNPTDEGVAEVLRILEKQKAQTARRDEQRLIISAQFGPLQEKCRRLLAPMKPADARTKAPSRDFLFSAARSDAGRKLPPYYLVYFLLVELLGFEN